MTKSQITVIDISPLISKTQQQEIVSSAINQAGFFRVTKDSFVGSLEIRRMYDSSENLWN
jgi:hypothetical protein